MEGWASVSWHAVKKRKNVAACSAFLRRRDLRRVWTAWTMYTDISSEERSFIKVGDLGLFVSSLALIHQYHC